jgi:membrane-bound lytic murein transglycosylase B
LFTSHQSVIFSVANYLEKHNWHQGQAIARALNSRFAYNPKNSMSTSHTHFDLENRPHHLRHWEGYRNLDVIMTYNNSVSYAMSAMLLSQAIQHNYHKSLQQKYKNQHA